jgi:hypothetical protein
MWDASRCVLRLYNLTFSNTQKGHEFRARAMDAFGELMENRFLIHSVSPKSGMKAMTAAFCRTVIHC